MKKIDGYELKPCPFCGGEELEIEIDDVYNEINPVYVVCRGCQADGPWDLGESGAIERWNERPREGD
jgi:Lar family restriction alleviation protein